ncbi:class I SAM-dependent methyltransferase [Lysinibacillus endophyticus]|uniref:class I SAM-dependent methyltransferase n=1 Tax=Ureibacillus endophyticus TaxID=1978490 RepID=UPI003134878E
MDHNQSSITSLMTAFGRAYHFLNDTPKIYEDSVAIDLITDKEFREISDNLIKAVHLLNPDIASKYERQPAELIKWFTQVQLSPTTLSRSAYCDNVLLHELTLGVEQYVILGAGLDTFGLRHPELNKHLQIFEIDHPATQQFKQTRIENANYTVPDNLHFVSMDFTKRFDTQSLLDCGFLTGKKTFFSLLGVSYYLTKDELAEMLKELYSIVPPGSSIVMDYGDNEMFKINGLYNRVQSMVQIAAINGEPMKSCFAYKEIEQFLECCGLLIYEHLSPSLIHEQYFKNRLDYLSAFETIHFLHAVKKY